MRCFVCERRFRAGERVTVVCVWDEFGRPQPDGFPLCRRCHAEVVASDPEGLGRLPEIDLDAS